MTKAYKDRQRVLVLVILTAVIYTKRQHYVLTTVCFDVDIAMWPRLD